MPSSEYPLYETVWKVVMGSEPGVRKRRKEVDGVPIGCLLPPKKCARETFSYFPNSFSSITRVNTGHQDPLKGSNWRQSPPYAMLPLPLNGGDPSG